MIVKVKKLDPKAKTPSYAKSGDAGMDIVAIDVIYENEYVSYKTGLAIEIPEGYVGLLFPRSSVSKKELLLCNSVGVIDSGYRGEIEFRYKIVGNSGIVHGLRDIYSVGDRVGQIIILPYPQITIQETDILSDTERGEGGFGSTGTQSIDKA